MNKKYIKILIVLIVSCITTSVDAQLNIDYQKPNKAILDLADVSPAPRVRMDSNGEHMLFLYRDNFKSIKELSEEELRLGGLRINPKTNISSRQRYYKSIAYKGTKDKNVKSISGIPKDALLSNFSWSPNQSKMAFTNTTAKGVELWVLDIKSLKLKKVTEDNLNANMGSPYAWFKDNNAFLVKVLPNNKKSLIKATEAIPSGPTISVNDGKKAQNRTYQDLLKNKNDEHNFEQLVLSELHKVTIQGQSKLWKETDMYRSMSFSPDGNYIMVTTIEKPFSYLVPYRRFPSKTVVYTPAGKLVNEMLKVPLIEDLPKGFMSVRKGMRNLRWRNDRAATIVWAEALDEGDANKEAEFRDAVYELDAPFNGTKKLLINTKNRFYNIQWGNDNIAIAQDYWWNTRNTKAYLFNPSDNKKAIKQIYDFNYQDRYNDPGDFETRRNEYGRSVLEIDNNHIYLLGDGYSKEGIRPFVDKMNLANLEKDRLWRADGKTTLERIIRGLDMKKGKLLTLIESKNKYPNFYIRNIKTKQAPRPLTHFENPFKAMESVHKEVITYKRADGLELNATLYLPPNYDKKKKEKLPMLMWAYPREFKDKNSAGQVTSSPNEFTYLWYGSPLFWTMRGYVVLDDAAFPIVGEGKEEPNDSFRKQLVDNAKAAIDAVDELGYIDRDRVAVGGHSYGAFMTANLLSHSDLFAAGIARSGAYNRTLTPFGFQSEERNYWEAPEVYYTMSPFMHADKMKTPLLLIHGEADNNSGTYPMQSERYFNALKGLGATVRLVMLPKESHGYAAKESIMHMLWEQDKWLEKYVKNKHLLKKEKEEVMEGSK